MNKEALVGRIHAHTGLPKKKVEVAVNAIIGIIDESLNRGEEVVLREFGAFYVKERPARMRKDPRFNSWIQVPPRKVVVFRASDVLKERINNFLKESRGVAQG